MNELFSCACPPELIFQRTRVGIKLLFTQIRQLDALVRPQHALYPIDEYSTVRVSRVASESTPGMLTFISGSMIL